MNFKQVLDSEGVVVFTNKGISMLPLIHEGKDVMIITKTDKFRKKDAVLFIRDSGEYVVHRITKIKDNNYYIIGDNCNNGEWVKKENILGVLTGLKHNGKVIQNTSLKYKLYVLSLPLIRLNRKIHYFLHLIKNFIKKKILNKKS